MGRDCPRVSTFALGNNIWIQTRYVRIDILTVVPELLESPLKHSIVGRAQQAGYLELEVHNIRDYSTNKWRRVDDYPFGGEAGMILQIEPIDRAISDLKSQRTYDEVIYTSPDGETFNQGIANELSLRENLIILCGHYKGIDHRIREHLITREISVGDYVLTGGELPAAIMTDAIVRLLRVRSQIPSKTISLLHRFTHVQLSTKGGVCQRSYSVGMLRR